MDDSLEQPTTLPSKIPPSDGTEAEDERSSDEEEDGGLDWTKL